MSKEAIAEGITGYPYFPAIQPNISQKVSVTGTSAPSSSVASTTSILRLFPTTDMHIAIGANPTAVADGTNMFLPGGIVSYIGVPENQSFKVAAIQDASAGTLYITEGA